MIRISLIALFILTTCFKDETVSGQTDSRAIWQLTAMNETPIDINVTITFPEEGKIAGQAPCNRYFGNQTVPFPWFEVSGLGSTRMACQNMELEGQYFALLQKMTTAEIVEDTLVLRNDAGDTLMFKKN